MGTDGAKPGPLREAAELAFALIRFGTGAAHEPPGSRPAGFPHMGVEAFQFMPASARIASGEVASFLAGLPSPAMLLQTTVRGTLSLVLLEELSGERAQAARREFDNQRTLLEEMIRQSRLGPDSRILLELDTEPQILSLAAMRIWAERFVVIVGWAITRLDGNPRADARMAVVRSDGVRSPGWPGPGR
jgi:hypothetical protein